MRDLPFTICGVDDLDRLVTPKVSHVVSIIDPGWPSIGALSRLPASRVHRFNFNDVIAPRDEHDTLPDASSVARIIEAGRAIRDDDPRHLLVHCQMGVSRSSAATLIILAEGHPGEEMTVAERIMERRPQAWPNSLILELADRELDRGGRLIEAGRAIRRNTARMQPDFADYIRTTHRRAEAEDLGL
ncbi:MAG: tyrosine phosphatase family protein [Minwuia sp.]|uniref:tyrosine phosphatase family protein n=1 Tax=Minwuia sp. TaxID=2493630 RepID=UPI003A87CF41